MEHKEIFKELAKCKIKGMMFHSNMADYYAFLGCCVLRESHECHFKEDACSFREIKSRYIMHHNSTLLTDDENLSIENITPSNWESNTLTKDETKQYIRRGVEYYVTWETGVKDKLIKLAEALYEDEHYDDYVFVKEMIDDVILEISHAKDLQDYLNSKGFEVDTDEGFKFRI